MDLMLQSYSLFLELNKALVFLELGARRDEEVISKKIDSIYKMGREPKPVQA